jgi:RAD51-like protein 2
MQQESWQRSYSINALALAPTVRAKLQLAGFHCVQDILRFQYPIQLCKQVNQLTLQEAQDCLQIAKSQGDSGGRQGLSECASAFEILRREQERIHLTTFCESLDECLGGGVSVAEITEFCGAPGVGKTQIGMQLAVSCQIPEMFGGNGGQCVYVDTEGSFTSERVEDMAVGSREWLSGSIESYARKAVHSKEETSRLRDCLERDFTVDKILERIHVFRCHEVTELLACLDSLPDFMKEWPKVKLVVVDSIAFHFRQDFDDMALRASILAKTTNGLMSLAKRYDLAVVTINQATTKPGGRLAPALGESYAHAATTRVALSWGENENRIAYIAKSPRLANKKALYTIKKAGVRDVENTEENNQLKRKYAQK